MATFGTLRKTLNIDFGKLLESQLVTAVTVRTSHRRRGLLRRMMSENLAMAKQDGLAMAALTACEGSIYGRFGHGVASFERAVKVDTTSRFQLNYHAAGNVDIADPRVLLDLVPEVILDVAQALEARHYPEDGRLVLDVQDLLGLTAGTFAVEVSGGEAGVVCLEETAGAELTLDVSALSSIYLGAVCPVTLTSAGRIREHKQGASLRARRMFAVERATHCLTHF
ncbi:GNAT family N-acetyltransferase [Pseudarthrobacter sp. AL07]|uniref:GNAT family N-acetyltransferase n=1 Tax=unclassified Pseudarthrobacter TaxID=2647000 RepID=UPI00249B21B2|nr:MULTISPECIES: GNAT family N-acetyltransferase [unclassified Pseudarthrobacter]MDI3195048.1 GNAT family N-acetyltransferase [Pseudarthrobacter sp. AL20]MDI3209080.1 GNAT family N-acetyltransferase [Pseudarthrobacter sp. AL07]